MKLCISHVKDIDGVSSAALAKAATGCQYKLVDYDQLFQVLDSLPRGLEELIICDLGTDPSRFDRFSEAITRISASVKVTYIDHHYLEPDAKKALKRLPITFVHDVRECAGMLTYLHFRPSLPEEAKMISLYAAVTDYMDNSPNARTMMETFDRHLVLLESTLLSYSLAYGGDDPEYARMLVDQLSRMRLPHEIPGVPENAMKQAEITTALAKKVKKGGAVMGSLAYIETTQASSGTVAKLLLGAFGTPVGVAFKKKKEGRTELSLRCTSACKVHLGKAIGAIALKYGGNGGGHDRAAGASVPSEKLADVLRDLDSAVAAG